MKQYWKLDIELIATSAAYKKDIKDATAGLMIGDRALEQRNISAYKFDLGSEWKKFTGLPFVFAAWISNKKLDPAFITAFNKANGQGLQHIHTVVNENPYKWFDLNAYYTSYIKYSLDENARKGLITFLGMLNNSLQGPDWSDLK